MNGYLGYLITKGKQNSSCVLGNASPVSLAYALHLTYYPTFDSSDWPTLSRYASIAL